MRERKNSTVREAIKIIRAVENPRAMIRDTPRVLRTVRYRWTRTLKTRGRTGNMGTKR
jgi:hypothetical protein